MLDEATLLRRMKELVDQYQNPAVYTQEFLAMTHQPYEGVRHYLSRLKGVAFNCTCSESVTYAKHLTMFKLVAGLVDEEIKEDILGSREKALEETVKTVEANESAKRVLRSCIRSLLDLSNV